MHRYQNHNASACVCHNFKLIYTKLGAITFCFNTSFINFSENVTTLTPQGPWWKLSNAAEKRNENSILFVEAMASCTAITYVDGKLVGDPLDV